MKKRSLKRPSKFETLGVVDPQNESGEYTGEFYVVRTGDILISGGACNVGFLPSFGVRLRDVNGDLCEAIADLEAAETGNHPSDNVFKVQTSLVW